MPSPFPGMDPYLEASHIWEDLHARLANEISDQLTPRLRPRYVAALTPRVTYEAVAIMAVPRTIKPDVGIYQTQAGPQSAAAVMEMTAPLVRTVMVEEPFHEYALEIRDSATGSLVTAIEILSPINKKPGAEAFAAYHRKRREVLRTAAHLLEIDLLRGGRRPPPLDDLPTAPYFVFLSRADRRGLLEIWPLHFRQPLPLVPVPLQEPDPDVPLDLGKALHAIYERAAYDLRLDYTQPPPDPALSSDDAQWVEALLHTAGLRA
jgi:Protein of unknown function (DUF4058)